MTDDESRIGAALADGYEHAKLLANGELAALRHMLFTTGLCVGVRPHAMTTPWRTRYCYEKRDDAVAALFAWDGAGDPPGPWIKQKPEERLNPKWSGDAAPRA